MTTGLLKRTPLYDLHVDLGAKMAPFAGYEMPIHYEPGILKEHLHTRAAVGVFDVSHMGQVQIRGGDDIHLRFERLVPADIFGLERGRLRYSMLLNEQGGVLDDIMIFRPESDIDQNTLSLIVNAACKDRDVAHMQAILGGTVAVDMYEDRALLALQGPKAAAVLGQFCDAPQRLGFMQGGTFALRGYGDAFISRSGYTGEDGFEISLPAARVEKFVRQLLYNPDVMMIGLGARDSLRMEAGMPLYGHELDETITPVEAGLSWVVSKRRRQELPGFLGAETVLAQIKNGPPRRRVALMPEGRTIARENTPIQSKEGQVIGSVTSGGFGPSVNGPIAMGYINSAARTGDVVQLIVRDKPVSARIVDLPFVPHHYVR